MREPVFSPASRAKTKTFRRLPEPQNQGRKRCHEEEEERRAPQERRRSHRKGEISGLHTLSQQHVAVADRDARDIRGAVQGETGQNRE